MMRTNAFHFSVNSLWHQAQSFVLDDGYVGPIRDGHVKREYYHP